MIATRVVLSVFLLAASGEFVAGQETVPDRLVVVSDGHPITVWHRAPRDPRRVILLVHGRTWSSRPDFDLQVPGLERSVMRSLAARGVATYAVDLRGYGQTPRDPSGWLTPSRAAADVINVLSRIAADHPSLPPPALLGWSRGGAIAALVARMAPGSVSSIVLFGFVWEPGADLASMPDAKGPPLRTPNTAQAAASDFVSPRVTPPAVIRAFVTAALRADPVLVDVNRDREFAALDPSALTMPTLVIFGERDPNVSMDTALALVKAIPAKVKLLVTLPGADHAAQLENTHDQWIDAVASFVSKS